MSWPPHSVAYGIRHERTFSVPGRIGQAVDALVALQGSGAVPRKCFAKIGWPDPFSARLTDADQNFALTLNMDGIVLTVDLEYIEFTRPNARDMFAEVVATALPITRPGRLLNRIGMIEEYRFPQPAPGALAAEALTRLTGIGAPTDFTFRASFRRDEETGEGDWWNTILQVAAAKTDDESESHDSLRISIDSQHYFVPDRAFTPNLVREHYVAFFEEAERLQQNQLAGLKVSEAAAEAQHG